MNWIKITSDALFPNVGKKVLQGIFNRTFHWYDKFRLYSCIYVILWEYKNSIYQL